MPSQQPLVVRIGLGDFAPAGATGGPAPWTPATFGKAAKAFYTGLVCECLCFMPASGVFCIFFVMILKFDFRGNLLSSIDKLPKIWFNSTEDKRKRRGGFAYFGQK